MSRLVASAPPWAGPIIYMACHLAATLCSLSLSALWWHSYPAHCAFLVALIVACAYRGATFYLDFLLRKAKEGGGRAGS